MGVEAITQTTAVATTIRVLGSKTTADGAREYKVGDLIDYHRTPDTKDDRGGWNGPCRVIENLPDEGKLIVINNVQNISVRYPDARHTLFIESVFVTEICKNHEAFEVIINYIARLPAGKHLKKLAIKILTQGH